MSQHLGSALNAFVDGELDAHREGEVLAHLAWCPECSAQADALRSFKSTLRQCDPSLPSDLSDRLMAISTFPTVATVQHARRRSATHLSPRVRRTAASGAFVVLGLGGALQLAGPPPQQPVAPVDPTNAGFVVDHRTTSGEVPFTTVDVVPVTSRGSATPAP